MCVVRSTHYFYYYYYYYYYKCARVYMYVRASVLCACVCKCVVCVCARKMNRRIGGYMGKRTKTIEDESIKVLAVCVRESLSWTHSLMFV